MGIIMKDKKTRLLYLDWADYGRMAYALTGKIRKSNKKFDLVIGIARGGVPLAMVISDQLGVKIDIINVKSYTGIRQRGKPKVLSTLTDGVKGRRILLVDDLIEDGNTMKMMTGYVKAMKPKSLMTAALFVKPWSRFEPDYWHKTVDRWIVFPWERGEVRRIKSAKK